MKIDHVYRKAKYMPFETKTINVNKVLWKDLKEGDEVYITGNLVDGEPTACYGKHKVVDPKRQQLENGTGVKFFERSEYLFVEMPDG